MNNRNFDNLKFYKEYVKLYRSAFSDEIFNKISLIQNVIEKKIRSKNFIYVCGNGGSAAVANHFLCDFNKGIKEASKKKILPKIISLSNSIEHITAIANDLGYEKIFKEQIENYATSKDCLIVLSCSGNSKNILNLVNFAKKKKMYVISLTGFNSRKFLKKKSNINLNIGIKNYGICEDVFQSIMHIISQKIRIKYYKKKNFIL